MNQICLLDEEEIRKIAAGEVVQRPANIIKELLENSIDAEAKNIILSIKAGGKKEIFIQDDGLGMDEKNLELSIIPHATSKIKVINDLASLKTFGFRGEALASISAISELEINSKPKLTKIDDSGASLKLCFGKNKIIESVMCHEGTSISIKKIFENTPVRKKFMRSDEVESNLIWTVFVNVAIPNYNVSFKFLENDNVVCNAPHIPNILDRIAQLFDHKTANNLLPILFEREGVKISGFTSNLQINRYNKSHCYLFINGRPFRDNKITNAVCQGYQGALPAGRFPISFIFFEMDQAQVDVNIHPSKEEILFLEHHKIIRFCKEAVFDSLQDQLRTLNLNTDPSNIIGSTYNFEPATPTSIDSFIFNVQPELEESTTLETIKESSPKQFSFATSSLPSSFETFSPKTSIIKSSDFLSSQASIPIKEDVFIGQIWDTYLILQKKESLIFIDQHAASERILYEKMKSNFEHLPKIKLLFPLILEFSESNIILLESMATLFAQFGIIFEKFGKQQLVIQATPPSFDTKEIEELLYESLDIFDPKSESKDIRKKIYEKIHSQIACKTAIKAGTKLSILEMEYLWKELCLSENKFQCIHGRPTIFEIKKDDVQKWFLRR